MPGVPVFHQRHERDGSRRGLRRLFFPVVPLPLLYAGARFLRRAFEMQKIGRAETLSGLPLLLVVLVAQLKRRRAKRAPDAGVFPNAHMHATIMEFSTGFFALSFTACAIFLSIGKGLVMPETLQGITTAEKQEVPMYAAFPARLGAHQRIPNSRLPFQLRVLFSR
jgi:hypothetical protein